MKVLIVNAGSSSLKYQLVDMDNEQMIVKGQVERIAIEGSHLNQKTDSGPRRGDEADAARAA